MAAELPTLDDVEDGFGLSTREGQLLRLATQGHTDQAISNALGISIATVGTYWGRIRIKLGPLNRAELVAKFLGDRAHTTFTRLRAENDSLLKQLEEHSQTEERLRTSLQVFRGLVETAPDAILLIDEYGSIQFANEQAADLFGYLPEELLAMSVEDLVPPRHRTTQIALRREYNENPGKRRLGAHLATMALRKDGREFPMATALSATKTAKGLIVACIVRDLSASF